MTRKAAVRPPPPERLIGGVPRTNRAAPAGVADAPSRADYASVIGANWDTWKENLHVVVPPALIERLARAKEEAAGMNDRGGQAVTIELGAERLQVRPHGGKGVSYILDGDDFSIEVRLQGKQHYLGVRYGAAGLWEWGLDRLQGRVYRMAEATGCRPAKGTWCSVSYCHYAVDFWSPAFTREMRPGIAGQVVCTSKVKVGETVPVSSIGAGRRVETLTVGAKGALQVQVYDKGREITEVSGKCWMLEVWAREGYQVPDGERPRDVWRVEVRLPKEWLRERGIRSPGDVLEHFPQLIAEALYARRLCCDNGDRNPRRWPLHPLFVSTRDAARAGRAFRPLGRRYTMRRHEISRLYLGQAAGLLLADSVLMAGDYDPEHVERLLAALREKVASDPRRLARVAELIERFENVDEAR